MRGCDFTILFTAFVIGCGSPQYQPTSAGGPLDHIATPHTTPFDIRVFAKPGKAGKTTQIDLLIEVDIPEGSYVISALSEHDYLGSFKVTWQDSTISPEGSLVEFPFSILGWEPFDQVYTLMLVESTTVRQSWNLPNGTGPFSGQVSFVLEPECVLYALDFTIEKQPGGWSSTNGLVHRINPQ